MRPQHQRLRVVLRGVVQGVGLRPFVYRLATERALTGWVNNDTHGVCLEVEGPAPALRDFVGWLQADKPPHACIDSMATAWLPPAGYSGFAIRPSDVHGPRSALVPADLAPCADCLADMCNEADRRGRYPFTNCTHCSPRFTILEALPYDRRHTTMRRFAMCPSCQAECADPQDRRFHAQPNACPACGPHLALWTPSGGVIAERDQALQRAAAALLQGAIVAVKGLGGFHLMADARHGEAIARLRQRKQRHAKPLALMVGTLEEAQRLCHLQPAMAAYLTAPEAPILLLRRRSGAPVADNVAPDNPYLGVMLPATPLHYLLLRQLNCPVVATSGNLSDEPICIDEHEALQRLGQLADLFLVHDWPIARHVDDSMAWVVLDELRLLRRARGYAPLPVLLPDTVPTILAVGAHLKNTVALSVGQRIFLSQHIGDVETLEAFTAFERVIADLLRLYAATPVAIAHDRHPDYLSTHWARQRADRDNLHLVPVQHHHAHLAACLADNHLSGPALGVTWDGTGYGLDGTVWGGEFLHGTPAHVVRVAHLRPFCLPGGAAAVRQPCRVALAVLWAIYGEQALELEELAPIQMFRPAERRVLAQMLASGVNAPRTTSAGRLFDAVAALLGLCQQTTFEGQAAMALEYVVDTDVIEAYPFGLGADHNAVLPGDTPLVLDWQPLLEAVLADLRRGVAPGVMAARFHNALAEAIVAVARAVGEPQVALTGGCFQNRLLTERTTQRLRAAGYQVLLHRQVPPNDGGISLGQVVVAAAQLQNA